MLDIHVIAIKKFTLHSPPLFFVREVQIFKWFSFNENFTNELLSVGVVAVVVETGVGLGDEVAVHRPQQRHFLLPFLAYDILDVYIEFFEVTVGVVFASVPGRPELGKESLAVGRLSHHGAFLLQPALMKYVGSLVNQH